MKDRFLMAAIILVLIGAGEGYAQSVDKQTSNLQNEEENQAEGQFQYKYGVKLSVLTLFDPIYPGIQLAFEHALSPKWRLQHELGYMTKIFNTEEGNYYFFDEINDNYRGVRTRNEVRLYLDDVSYRSFNRYYALELMYWQARYDKINQPIGMDCLNGDCNYVQYMDYQLIKQNIAYHIKFGMMWVTESGMSIDLYFGAGFRHVLISHKGVPDNSLLFNTRTNQVGNYTYPSVVLLGFKLGYLFRTKVKG